MNKYIVSENAPLSFALTYLGKDRPMVFVPNVGEVYLRKNDKLQIVRLGSHCNGILVINGGYENGGVRVAFSNVLDGEAVLESCASLRDKVALLLSTIQGNHQFSLEIAHKRINRIKKQLPRKNKTIEVKIPYSCGDGFWVENFSFDGKTFKGIDNSRGEFSKEEFASFLYYSCAEII